MNFEEYQRRAANTSNYPGQGTPVGLNYTVLGLIGESGEVANKLKKVHRDMGGDVKNPEIREMIAKELTDCLWYLSACAGELGYTLDQIAIMSLEKVEDRKRRGVIGGSGDER